MDMDQHLHHHYEQYHNVQHQQHQQHPQQQQQHLQQQYQQPQTSQPERIIQRVKANKKERRRTQSINQAFNELRQHIPNVPNDTKLSKIKTLRLAISYINHLASTLNFDQQLQLQPIQTGNNNSIMSQDDDQQAIKSYQLLGSENESGPLDAYSSTGEIMNNYASLAPSSPSYSSSLKLEQLAPATTSTTTSIEFKSTVEPEIGRQQQQQKSRDRKHRTGWPDIVWKTSSPCFPQVPTSHQYATTSRDNAYS